MPLWPKEIARPGPVTYIDGKTGEPRVLNVTRDDIKRWHDEGSAMLKAGLSVPVPLEHQADAKPMTAAERAAANLLNNAGYVKKYEVLHGDRLFAYLDIDHEEVARKIPKGTIKYTSPWINGFVDGDGKKWENVISHVALTTRPRVTNQEPFPSVAAALSLAQSKPALAASDTRGIPEGGIVFSVAGLLKLDNKGDLKPRRPKAFAAWAGARLAKNEFPEEEPEGEDMLDGGEKPARKAKEKPGEKPAEEHEYMPEAEMGLCDVLCDVVSALWGVELPEGTDEKNLAPRLMKGLMAYLKSKNMGGSDMNQNDGKNPDGAATTPTAAPVAETPPMYMSLTAEDVAKMADPGQRQLAEAFLSLREQGEKDRKKVEALEKERLAEGERRRQARVAKLAPRLNQSGRDKLAQVVGGVRLSMDDAGKVVDPIDAYLDIIESGLPSLPDLLKTSAAQTQLQKHPEDAAQQGGPLSDERAAAVAEEQARNARLVPRK